MLNGIILVKCGEIILKMKLLAYYSVIVVFAPLSWGDGVGGTVSGDSEIITEDCEEISMDLEDASQETNCDKACFENTFLMDVNDEEYVDDIPFDTEKVVEKADVGQQEIETKKAGDETITIFQLFIRWVTLLLRLN
ncbi:MAG: hypothetical protein B6D64_08965 [Bacteroidetes bacterium 4484_276]|nr:MAG: hypothetical protein B6D64_08965 [Bacteroidetes bacterium 4484_276]